jgi:hypothetical protein
VAAREKTLAQRRETYASSQKKKPPSPSPSFQNDTSSNSDEEQQEEEEEEEEEDEDEQPRSKKQRSTNSTMKKKHKERSERVMNLRMSPTPNCPENGTLWEVSSKISQTTPNCVDPEDSGVGSVQHFVSRGMSPTMLH